jgi:hypothetical protein
MLLQADTPTDIPQCSTLGPQRQRDLVTQPCNFSSDGPFTPLTFEQVCYQTYTPFMQKHT